jgi:hypothetical protein
MFVEMCAYIRILSMMVGIVRGPPTMHIWTLNAMLYLHKTRHLCALPREHFRRVLTKGRHGSARTCSLHCTLTPAARLHAHACSLRCTLGAIRSGTRYAKWAGGSRSQTHRRAAMGGFTQDDGYVRGVAPTHDCSSGSFSNC